jgi:hypothetical protein
MSWITRLASGARSSVRDDVTDRELLDAEFRVCRNELCCENANM